MRTALWLVIAGIVGLEIAIVAGCNSKDAPTSEPNVPGQSDSPPSAAAPSEPVYELDVAKHVVPAGPIVAHLGGERLTGEASIESGELVLQKPAEAPGDYWRATIKLPPEALRGEPFRMVIPPDRAPGASLFIQFPKPLQFARYESTSGLDPATPPKRIGWDSLPAMAWEGGCALTLELGKRVGNAIPGKLYVALPEMETQSDPKLRNFLAGTFEARYLRAPSDPPGADDVPFINGSVTVRGAPPGTPVVVGYVANPTPDLLSTAKVEGILGQSVPEHNTFDKPRVSSMIAGDGKDTPSRYEHSKLVPGRYLVFAAIKNGPAVWKWVDVRPQSTTAVDFTIDASQSGGLEVNAPLEALDKVQLAPADEPLRPALSEFLFGAAALQLQLEQPIVARKALFKGLGPGRYEVRANKQIRVVEIVAGKTMELDFDRKLPPALPDAAPDPKPKP